MSTLSLRKIKHDSSSVDNITLNTDGGVAIKGTPSTSYDLIVNGLGAQRVINTSGGRSKVEFTSSGVISYDIGTNADASFSLKQNGGSDFLKVDSAGRVTKPSQPSFCATNQNAINMPNSDTTVTFAVEHWDIGGNFNHSTGRFTAPVYGIYHFSFISSVVMTSTSQYLAVYPHVNGSSTTQQYRMREVTNSASGGVYGGITGSFTYVMSAGDYIELKTYSQVNNSASLNETTWTGFLIG